MNKIISLLLTASLLGACSTAPQYQTTQQREIDALTQAASFEMPQVPVPSFPDRTYTIADFGADPTGIELATNAIQTAIDECNAAGGGTVIIPAGVYTSGPIQLKSNVRLYTEPNSLVMFSHDLDQYEIYDTWFEGIPTKRCTSPLNAFGAENIAITGHGVFNGNGEWWRPLKKNKMAPNQWKQHLKKGGVVTEKDIWYPDSASILAQTYCVDQNVPVITDDSLWKEVKSFLRPVLVHFVGCKNILLEGVTFENSPAWNIHPMCCENLILRDLTVRNPWYSQNGDGVDVESCKNVVISRCSFDVGDDAICMKSGKNKPGRDRGIPTENVVVDDCTVYHGHGGFVIGSEMSGGARCISVRRCVFIGTDTGLRFKSTRGRGGVVEKIYIDGINMYNIEGDAVTFDLYYGIKPGAPIPPVNEETPQFKDIYISHTTCQGAKRTMWFNGLPEMPIKNIVVSNSLFHGKSGAIINYVDGVTFENVSLEAESGDPISQSNSIGIEIR